MFFEEGNKVFSIMFPIDLSNKAELICTTYNGFMSVQILSDIGCFLYSETSDGPKGTRSTILVDNLVDAYSISVNDDGSPVDLERFISKLPQRMIPGFMKAFEKILDKAEVFFADGKVIH